MSCWSPGVSPAKRKLRSNGDSRPLQNCKPEVRGMDQEEPAADANCPKFRVLVVYSRAAYAAS
jgi:hypothetical protein